MSGFRWFRSPAFTTNIIIDLPSCGQCQHRFRILYPRKIVQPSAYNPCWLLQLSIDGLLRSCHGLLDLTPQYEMLFDRGYGFCSGHNPGRIHESRTTRSINHIQRSHLRCCGTVQSHYACQIWYCHRLPDLETSLLVQVA
ncbi:hypothetical protein PSPO01_03268 [Paraphaeosphaeria sporulosa]